MLKTLTDLNPQAYKYRIGKIVQQYKDHNIQIAEVGN